MNLTWKGATKEIGTALTRICLRHKAVEARVKTFTRIVCFYEMKLMHSIFIEIEYKRARAELKKKSTDTLRLQKKAARKGGSMAPIGNSSGPVGGGSSLVTKLECTGVGTGPVIGGPDLQHQLDVSLADVNERRHLLEEAEHKAACAALVEERSRYCIFVACLKPVVDEEVAMLGELTHLQEVLAQLEKHTADPYSLPQASEQVILELRSGKRGRGHRGTPPSSPSSSLGSRKSSMCSSISSLNSSSSGSLRSHPSPSHHYWHRSLSQS
ncbi:hypothetical protein J437_LFUL017222 [Ladona fulva]|uniref:IMD domain-containing protein n=1 Tax=Ladona fulva TaxID=123851 RepID=A0A8K0P8B7_LADFU|nr:hypothetical protein J437_LFUL017222 [Ladona fulva]